MGLLLPEPRLNAEPDSPEKAADDRGNHEGAASCSLLGARARSPPLEPFDDSTCLAYRVRPSLPRDRADAR